MSDPNATQNPENQLESESSVEQENTDREENKTSVNDFQESTEQTETDVDLNEAFESEIEALDQLSSEDHFDELNELAALDGADPELLSAESEEPTDESDAQSDAQSNDEIDSDINIDPAVHDDVDLGEEVLPEVKEKGDPYGGHEHEALKRILEAALFASGTTLSVSHLGDIFEKLERPHSRMIRQLMAELIAAYENRGVRIIEVASGYRFQTVAETAHWISRLWEEKPQRYSRALMETIALIAYRQPITRGEIEDVRGVAVSSNIVRTLLEREWVRVVGHRDVPGRPAMYATTRQFLDYFGLKALDQLPNLSEIRSMDELNPQMDIDDNQPNTEEGGENQSEITFSGMIDKIREAQQEGGKTGSEFIDEQLDVELAAMDEVNKNFESALEQQRAEHEHPDLDLEEDAESPNTVVSDESATSVEPSVDAGSDSPAPESDNNDIESNNVVAVETPQTELSEEEQWKVIQEKLAQQQALLDNRETDQSREEEENE